MSGEELRAKWDARHAQAPAGSPPAARVLDEFAHLLPATGQALDLACGLGGNARRLAQQGLRVQAWDFSPVAIARLQTESLAGVQAQLRDVIAAPPPPASFDVIVVSYFLHRPLFGALRAALRPGGLLYYQTFLCDKVSEAGPTDPAFLLQENELLARLEGMRILVYREEGRVGDPRQGLRNEAYCVALQR
jgi:SAM-dependent methyltransferase